MRNHRRWFLLLAGCTVTGICLWLLARRIDGPALASSLGRAGAPALLGAVAIYLAGFVLRGLRWSLMLRDLQPVPPTMCMRSALLGYAANNVLPFRLGEVVRSTVFARQSGISSVTTLASIFAERLLDALSLVSILAATLGLAGGLVVDARLRPVLLGAAILAAFGVVALAALVICALVIERSNARNRLPPHMRTLLDRIAAAGIFLRSPARTVLVAVLSLAVWCWEGLMFVLVAGALDFPSPWITGYLMLGVVNLGILVPSAPGYIGVFQAAAVLAGAVLGLPEPEALAAGILVHAAQFIPVTLIGLVIAWPLWHDINPFNSTRHPDTHHA